MIKNFGALVLGLVAACGPAAAVEPWVLYDDFSASLSPDKWPSKNHERFRSVEANVMRFAQGDWGDTNSSSGRVGNSWSNTLSRGTAVTQLRSFVRVNEVNLTGCAANPAPTRVRARLLGTFFNTGNRTPGSNVGDVLAQVYLYRDSNSADPVGTLRIEGSVVMCTDSSCNQATLIGTTGSLGTTTLGKNVLLQIEWDRVANQFTFIRDATGATPATAVVSYNTANISLDDSAEPGNVFKNAGTRTDVASCGGGPAARGFIYAQFDNVSVNKTAKP